MKLRRRGRVDGYSGELDLNVKAYLKHGHPFFDHPPISRAHLQAAWIGHGKAITQAHIAQRPGSRPWGAWEFDIVPKHGEPQEGEPVTEFLVRNGLLTAYETKLHEAGELS